LEKLESINFWRKFINQFGVSAVSERHCAAAVSQRWRHLCSVH